MTRHRFTDDEREAYRTGTMSEERRVRNLVEAFQTALRTDLLPNYRVLGYKPLNAVNIRVRYTAPVWDDEPQFAMVKRHSIGAPEDRMSTWTTYRCDPNGKITGDEIVRFDVNGLTGEFVRSYGFRVGRG